MRVLLATDHSSHSTCALNYLRALPIHSSIDLLLLTVGSPSPSHKVLSYDDSNGSPDWLRDQWENIQKHLMETARQHQAAFKSVDTVLATGSPGREIVRRCRELSANIVVVGAEGHSAIARMLLGSVSDYVATHANCSALIVRPPADQKQSDEPSESLPTRVLIAIGNAENDIETANWIEKLELPFRTAIHLVHVMEDVPFFEVDLLRKASEYWKEVRSVAASHIETLEQRLRSAGFTTRSEMLAAPHIGSALLDYAKKNHCELIITGDQRETVAERVFLGSTSRYVLRHAIGSVLISR